MIFPEPRKAGRLVQGQEGIWAMGHSSEVSYLPTQLKRQGVIVSSGLVHISFQKVQGPPCFVGLPGPAMV